MFLGKQNCEDDCSVHGDSLITSLSAFHRTEAPKTFTPKEGAEKFTFQAEVNRLMDILIHSLYSNKVGLGPLVSRKPWYFRISAS